MAALKICKLTKKLYVLRSRISEDIRTNRKSTILGLHVWTDGAEDMRTKDP
jgi:hypothetical protein